MNETAMKMVPKINMVTYYFLTELMTTLNGSKCTKNEYGNVLKESMVEKVFIEHGKHLVSHE